MRQPHNISKIFKIIFLNALFTFILDACIFESKNKRGQRSGGQSRELVIRDSIFFDRSSDRTQGRISFKTSIPVSCEWSYVPQDGTSQDRSLPKVCTPSPQSPSVFQERLSDLDPSRLYFILITVKNLENTNESDSVTVREPQGASPPSAQTPSPDTPQNPQDPGTSSSNLSELLIGRVDLVLKSGEVFRHTLSPPQSPEEIRASLKPTLGCFDQPPTKIPAVFTPDNSPGITQLATKDLGSSSAKIRSDIPGILLLDYSFMNDGIDKWTFMYRYKNLDQIFTSRPIIRISKFEMLSDSTYELSYPNLDETANPMKINSNKELLFRWSIPPQTPASSYVHIQIGRSNLPKSVYCVFQADARRALIDARYLSNIESGQHVISAALSTTQFAPKENWVTTAIDWRSGRIEK